MVIKIKPSTISGTLPAPPSKSCMQRACALALLHNGPTKLVNPGASNDDLAALEMIKQLGATVQKNDDGAITIISDGFINRDSTNNVEEIILDPVESGLGIRMFAPIAALSSHKVRITGRGSLLKRPMHFFESEFPKLCISVMTENGHLPMQMQGPLTPTDIDIDGSLSSQFLTGLLLSFGKAAKVPVTISVNNLKSKPYVDLTLKMMADFGYQVRNENYEKFVIEPVEDIKAGQTNIQVIEGDWSGAAFLLVAGAIAGSIALTGLDLFSTQADKAVLQALMQTGCILSMEESQISVSKSVASSLKPFHFNATDCPDLFPPLASLAAFCDGTSVIEGVGRLVHKESNRALTLQEEFAKIGIKIDLQDDLMLIHGNNQVQSAKVHSHHDHRIAMAMAVIALRAEGEMEITEADAINKSYPAFYEDLKKLGTTVSL